MTTEQRLDDIDRRLDRLVEVTEAHGFQFSELRESQALLVQMFSEQQEALAEYRRVTNASLDRMERNQAETNQRLDAIEARMDRNQAESNQRFEAFEARLTAIEARNEIRDQRMEMMQQQNSAMQQQIFGILDLLRERFNGG